MKRLILIDGNNWGFGGVAKAPLYSGERQTQAIYYVINRIREVVEKQPESTIMVLWDGRSWRYNYYPEYKGNRTTYPAQVAMKEEYLRQKPDILTSLELLGIQQVTVSNMEADDLAQILTAKSLAKGVPVTLLTADEDWQQLVQRGVNWFDVMRDKSCRFNSFKRDTGFENPRQFVEAKCILGDAGDNIKGIHGVGPKALEGVYKTFRSFKLFLGSLEHNREAEIEFWRRDHDGKPMPKALRELNIDRAYDTINMNLLLMDLSTDKRPAIGDKKIVKGSLDQEKFEEFCNRNAFRGIARTLDEFLAPFKEYELCR